MSIQRDPNGPDGCSQTPPWEHSSNLLTIYPSADLMEFLGGTSPHGRHLSRGVCVPTETGDRFDAYVCEIRNQAFEHDPNVEVRIDFEQIRCSGATKDAVYLGDVAPLERCLRDILHRAGEVAHGLKAPTETP